MELAAAILCAFAGMPGGPPGRVVDGSWFQMVPVNRGAGRSFCPDIIPRKDVTFHLYQGHVAEKYHSLAVYDEPALKRSGFDHRLPTVLYIHGFRGAPAAADVTAVKNAYLARGDHNFIVVGWRKLSAGPWYKVAVNNVMPVGEHVAQFLDFLTKKTGPLEDLHLIGHKLGAHVAGVAANSTTVVRVPRITGLDPTVPILGRSAPPFRRLDPADATFVDVIHTDAAKVKPLVYGHADFFVNRGKEARPGCLMPGSNPAAKVPCRPVRAVELYAASVLRQADFPAMRCLALSDFEAGRCQDPSEVVPLGYAVPSSARGSYFLMHKPPQETKKDNQQSNWLKRLERKS